MSYITHIQNLYRKKQITMLEMLELKTSFYSLDHSGKLELDNKFNSVNKTTTDKNVNDTKYKDYYWLECFNSIAFEFKSLNSRDNVDLVKYSKKSDLYDFASRCKLTDGLNKLFIDYYTFTFFRSRNLPNGKEYYITNCYYCDKSLEDDEECNCDEFAVQPGITSSYDYKNSEEYLQSLDSNSLYLLLEKIANVNTDDYTQNYKTIGKQNGTIQLIY